MTIQESNRLVGPPCPWADYPKKGEINPRTGEPFKSRPRRRWLCSIAHAGRKLSEDQCVAMSKARKGKPLTPAQIAGYERRRGRPPTPAEKAYHEARKGKPHTPAQKAATERRKGLPRTPAQKAYDDRRRGKQTPAMRAANERQRGRPPTPAQKAGNDRRRGRPLTPAQIAANAARRGVKRPPFSEEHKARLRKAAAGRLPDIDRKGEELYIAFNRAEGLGKVGLTGDVNTRNLGDGWEILYCGRTHHTGVIEATCHIRTGCYTASGLEEASQDPRKLSIEDTQEIMSPGGGAYWQDGGGKNGARECSPRWTVSELIEITRQTIEEIDGEAPDWLPEE